jgi:hypothetical protein
MKKLVLACTGGHTCLLKPKFFLNAFLYAKILSLSSTSPDCYALESKFGNTYLVAVVHYIAHLENELVKHHVPE